MGHRVLFTTKDLTIKMVKLLDYKFKMINETVSRIGIFRNF